MNIRLLESFEENFIGLPQYIQKKVIRKLGFFEQNPFHPSLRFKKLSSGEWQFMVDDKYRIWGTFNEKVFEISWVGKHP